MTLDQLIEDYERKLTKVIGLQDHAEGSILARLVVKEGCYRTFISELEKVKKEATE